RRPRLRGEKADRWAAFSLNDASPQAHVLAIENDRLARSHRPLRSGEFHLEVLVAYAVDAAGGVGLAVARLRAIREARLRRGAAHPGEILRAKLLRQQPRVVVPLHDDQFVFRRSLPQTYQAPPAESLMPPMPTPFPWPLV